jgi:hypothetical protein
MIKRLFDQIGNPIDIFDKYDVMKLIVLIGALISLYLIRK